MPVTATFSQNRTTAVPSNVFGALQVETQRLHRENTRLHNELTAREGPSFTAMQVSNTKLRRQVGALQDEVDSLKAQMDRLRAQLVDTGIEPEETADVGVQCGLDGQSSRRSNASSPTPSNTGSPTSKRSGGIDSERMGTSDVEDEDEEQLASESRARHLHKQMLAERPPMLHRRQLMEWSEHGGDQVETCLRSHSLALLDARYIVGLWDRFPSSQLPLPRRQDLPRAAFLSVDELKSSGCPHGGLPIVVVSCPWLSPHHPDPKGDSLRLVAMALKLICTNGKKYGVFWDYGSMMQPEDRDRGADRRIDGSDQVVFDDALKGLSMLYSHAHTTVFRVTRLPEEFPEGYDLPQNANTADYTERGWTFCENMWASWPCKETFDLGILADADMMPVSRQDLMRLCCNSDERCTPPVLPHEFGRLIEPKAFLNAKDDKQLVIELYETAFTAFFGAARKLDFSGLEWADEEADKLCNLINSGVLTELEFLHLASNQVRDTGMEKIGEAVANGKLPKCIKIVLDGNPGDTAPVVEALQAQAQEARKERLKKLWPGLRTTESSRPKWAVLPARMPSTENEDFLFQPARQAPPSPTKEQSPAQQRSPERRKPSREF